MPSPICTVNNGATANGVDLGGGSAFTIRLADLAGVNKWTIACIGTDERFSASAITGALTIDLIGKTATGSMAADDGNGAAWIFQSQVNDGKDANGVANASLTTTFGLYMRATNGLRMGALNETTEGHSTVGWVSKNNAIARLSGTAGTNTIISRAPALVATAAALPSSTYTTTGGGTITATANGALVVDGVSPPVNARVLVTQQAAGLQNGLYVVTATGGAGAAFVLTRASDANTSGLMSAFTPVLVQSGTTNGGKTFVLVTTSPTLGTTALRFIAQSTTVDARTLALSDGSTDDVANLQSAFLVAPRVIYSQGSSTYKAGTTATLGTTSSVHSFAVGAKVNVASGVTLTVAGRIDAGKDQQIFSRADATASVVVQDQDEVHPGWFGSAGNANFLHTDGKWYTDSGHSTEATDDASALRFCLDSLSSRSTAAKKSTVRFTRPHYLKAPAETGIAPFGTKRFFAVRSSTRYDFDGGIIRLGAGLQDQDYGIFHSNADLNDVEFIKPHFDCNSSDPSGSASTQRNGCIMLLGANMANITVESPVVENHAGYVCIIIADFTSAPFGAGTGGNKVKNLRIDNPTFRNVGNVVGLLDHISLYTQADNHVVDGGSWYNDPSSDAHSKDFGASFQIQGNGVTLTGGSYTNVPALGLYCSFFNISSSGFAFVGNTLNYVPVGLGFAHAVGVTLSDVMVSGNAGTMTSCSVGQIEGFIQTIGANGSDVGIDNFGIIGNTIRYVADGRFNVSQPVPIQFTTNIRSMVVHDNDFQDWPGGGIVISPVTFSNPNNIPAAAVATSDLKVWDLNVKNNRFKNCGVGRSTVNIVIDSAFSPLRRLDIRGNVIESVERVFHISNATNASPIVCTTCDEISGSAVPHGLTNAAAVTLSGVNGNTNANVSGYAKVTASALACTVTASTDLVHATSHGFSAGTRVTFSSSANGLVSANAYFVLSSGLTANDFKVSLSVGGSVVDITSDGSNTVNIVPTTFALYSDVGLTMAVAGSGAYVSGGVVQAPAAGAIANGIIVSGAGDEIRVYRDDNFFKNVTTAVTVTPSGNGMTHAYLGPAGLTLDDGTLSPARITTDSAIFGGLIAGSFRFDKVIALANAQSLWSVSQSGSTAYPLLGLDVNDFVRLAATARVVAVGPLVTATNAAVGDIVLCKGNGIRRENNAQTAALLLLDSDSSNYARVGFDTNAAGMKAYAGGVLCLQADGSAVSIPGTASTISMNGLSALAVSSGVLNLGFSNSWTGVKIYNGANSNYCFTASSTEVDVQFGGTSRIRVNGSGVGFNAQAPVIPSITGALSTVTDAAAKAVLTSLVAALRNNTNGTGLCTDGTT